jgi:hypothetical protein
MDAINSTLNFKTNDTRTTPIRSVFTEIWGLTVLTEAEEAAAETTHNFLKSYPNFLNFFPLFFKIFSASAQHGKI